MLFPGDEIGGCRVIEKLGEGGMGEVYRAQQLELEREVALKVLHSGETREEALLRFEREARVHMRLSHPHLVKIFGAGEDRGLRYLVLELVDGPSLRRILRTGKRFSWASASTGLAQMLDALEYLESAGVVHRDLKPDNILVDREARFKLVDFGLVKTGSGTVLTAADQIVGSPKYLAPEVLLGDGPAPKVDVYAAGLVVYEMLTGRLPYEGTDAKDWLRAIVQDPMVPLRDLRHEITVEQDTLLMRLLDRDPGRRPTAGEARRLLAGAPGDEPGPPAPAAPPPQRPGRTRSRVAVPAGAPPRGRPRLVVRAAAAGGALVALAAAAFVTSITRPPPPPPPSPAVEASPIAAPGAAGWVQRIPDTPSPGVPVIPWWDGTLHRAGKPLTAEEWRSLHEHNTKLDDGTRADVWLALAVFHGRGLGVPRDLTKAQHLLRRSAIAGHGMAMIALGWDPELSRRPDGKPLSREEHDAQVERWLEAAANAGVTSAMFELGVFRLRHGRPEECLVWWERAARGGEGVACVAMGHHHAAGTGPAADHAQARVWFQKGIDTGDPGSMQNLARLMMLGVGGPKDLDSALALATRAAELGDPWGSLRAAEVLIARHQDAEAERWLRQGTALLDHKTFDDIPRHPDLEELFAAHGHRSGNRPRDDIQLMRGSFGL